MTDIRSALGAHRRGIVCDDCGKTAAERQHADGCPRSRRGRTARRRGNDFERELVHALGSVFPDVTRTGQYGGPDDVRSRLLYVQAKKVAGLYPKRVDALLADTERHANADQYTAVALAHPGQGHRKLVVMELADFVNLLRTVAGEAREDIK